MLLRKSPLFLRKLSSLTTSFKWRNQVKQNQLVSQISSILIQRNNWIPLLRQLNLSLILTPNLFIQILCKTKENPEISLDFFNWAKTNVGFEPDLKSHCKIIQILVEYQLLKPARPLFDSIIRSEPASDVFDSMVEACKGRDSHSLVFDFLLERYSGKGLVFEALNIFKKIRVLGYVPSTRSCNALLDALQLTDDVKLAWKFYAAVVRSGIIPDSFSWSLIVRLLCREGNLKSAVRLLNLGIYSAAIYNLIIDCYCKNGNFSTAVDLLSEMHSKNLTPGFGTYSSILDGACKFGDAGVIEMITRDMVARKLLPAVPSSNYDQIIQNLCSLGKTYAAEMFFDKARDEKIKLRDASYGCLLKAFSKDGRVKKAISMYSTISERGITVDRGSIFALADLICKEEPSEEVYKLLKDVVERGFNPCALDVSKIIGTLSNEGRWKEVEDLVTVLVEKGFIPDSFCCCSLVEHYCSDRRIDLAVTLHHKIEKLGRCFDVTTYNLLLNGLFIERRIEEATRVFDHMRQHNVMTTDSFSIMIRGLCHEKELRKAMVIHDEMLRMGLKPDKATYKRLISGFV